MSGMKTLLALVAAIVLTTWTIGCSQPDPQTAQQDQQPEAEPSPTPADTKGPERDATAKPGGDGDPAPTGNDGAPTAAVAEEDTDSVTKEWPQWGGDSHRNNTPVGKGIPHHWKPGKFAGNPAEWQPDTAENVKWVARLGSQSYGNATLAGGKIYVGTNNRAGWLERDRSKLEEVQKMDDQIDVLESEILRYLGAIRTEALTEHESAELALVMKVADGFESVGDVIETDLVGLGYRALDENIQSSDAMRVLFSELGDKLSTALDSTIRAVREDDERAADEVLTIKADIDHLIGKALELQSQALAQVSPEQIELMRVEMTVLENLKRIHTLLKRVAREIVPQAVRV